MLSALQHEAAIVIAKAQADGPSGEVATLIALIERLQDQLNEKDNEFRRLERIEEEARSAHAYHLSGRSSHPDYDDEWDANEMIGRLDALGEVLGS